MTVLFVSCAVEPSRLSYPLASVCLKAAVDASPDINCRTQLMEYFLRDDPAAAAQHCLDSEQPVIACSIYVWNRAWFKVFIKTIKALSSRAITVIGGPEVTADPESFSGWGVDAVITGEGELALIAYLKAPERASRKVLSKPLTYEDLAALPSPVLSDPEHLKGYSGITWELTRGCPYSCTFCYESKGSPAVRSFSLTRLSQELEHIIRSEVSDVFILDPTFNMSASRAKEILHMLIEKAGTSVRFHAEIRAELLDEEMADLFSELDCALQIGLQSSDTRVLKLVGRKFDPELFLERCKLLAERGIVFGVDLIYGLPGDSLSGFFKSISYAASLGASNLDIFRLSVLPGTVLFDQAGKFNLTAESSAPYRILESPTFSSSDFTEADRIKSLADLFYTFGEAGIWFPKVCEAADLSGAEVLLEFGNMLERPVEQARDDDICSVQKRFVRDLLLKKHTTGSYTNAVISYISLHQAFNALTRTGQRQQVSLFYHPDDLAELDTLSLKFFASCFEQQESGFSVEYADDGSIVIFEQV